MSSLANPEKVWVYLDGFVGSTAGAYGRVLFTTQGKTIISLANNGSNLIRVTCTGHGYVTGNIVGISGSHASANGYWTVTVISSSAFDLQGSTFSATGTGVAVIVNENPVAVSTLINFAICQGVTGYFTYDMDDPLFDSTSTVGPATSSTWTSAGKLKYGYFVRTLRASSIDVGSAVTCVPVGTIQKVLDFNETRTNSNDKVTAIASENEWWFTTSFVNLYNLQANLNNMRLRTVAAGITTFAYTGNSKAAGTTYSGDSGTKYANLPVDEMVTLATAFDFVCPHSYQKLPNYGRVAARVQALTGYNGKPVPAFTKILVVIGENTDAANVLGSINAPYINTLISGGAYFSKSFGLSHPSQPNYIQLFSGSNQGITNDASNALADGGARFTTANLARELIDAGKTFKTYSEGLPSAGYDGATSGLYDRKHNPVTNWMGSGTNQVTGATVNVPWTDFPSRKVTNKALTSNVATLTIGTHNFIVGNSVTITGVDATFNGTYTLTAIAATTISYTKTASNVGSTASNGDASMFSTLPDVTFIIPNEVNNGHNSGTVNPFDTWCSTYMSAYATWAAANNSLLIVTWDEDDSGSGQLNQISTVFSGANLKVGSFANFIDHYVVLRTIEDGMGLTTHAGAANSAYPISNCWTGAPAKTKLAWIISAESAHYNKTGAYAACVTGPPGYSNFSGNFLEGRVPMAEPCPNPTSVPTNNIVSQPKKSIQDCYNYITHLVSGANPAQSGSPLHYDADPNTNASTNADVRQIIAFSWEMINPTVRDIKNGTIGATCPVPQTITLPVIATVTGIVIDDNLPSPTGSLATYSYVWSQVSGPASATINSPSNLTTTINFPVSGSYVFRFTVIDSGGATNNCTTTITVNPASNGLTFSLSQIENPTCLGVCDAAAVAVVTAGGTGPYTYAWTGPGGYTSSLQAPHNLCPGSSYTVTVTDTANSNTATQGITIGNNPPPVTVNITKTDILCNGTNTGAANAVAGGGGGGAPYTYAWTGPGGYTSSSQNITTLGPGTYTCTATDDNGCTGVASVTILQATAITNTGGTITHVNCFGASTGGITTNPSGGTVPYTFVWSRSGGGFSATTQNISGVIAGTYRVIITDANGCSLDTGFVLVVNAGTHLQPVVTNPGISTCFTVGGTPVTVSLTVSDTGALDYTLAGYTFLWSDGLTTRTRNWTLSTAGTHSITVTVFKSGCQASYTFTITLTSAPSLNPSVVQNGTLLACPGNTVTFSVVNAGSYNTILWYDSLDNAWGSGATSNTINTSSLFVDDHGQPRWRAECFQTGNPCPDIVYFYVDSVPVTITLNGIVNQSSCGSGFGAVDISVSGGCTPYTYAWSKSGGGFSATTQDISNLNAGTYTVTVTDAQSHTATQSFVVATAAALAGSVVITNQSCFGGSNNGAIDLTVTGGSTPYSYVWSKTGGGFSATTQDISGLAPGTYSCLITDAAGCTLTKGGNVVAAGLHLQPTITTPSTSLCTTAGTAVLTAADLGALDYTLSGYIFLWDNGSTGRTRTIAVTLGTHHYTVQVSKSGCSASAFIDIIVGASPDLTPVIIPSGPLSACAGSSITLSLQNHASYDSITWFNAAGTAWGTGTTSNAIHPSDIAVGNPFRAICLVIGSTCPDIAYFTVVAVPITISVVRINTPSLCSGAGGSIDISVTGGCSPYTYAWTGPNGFTATTQDIVNLLSGNYTVTVTDANASTSIQSHVVNAPFAIAITITAINVSTPTATDGSLTATVTGGATPYTYSWTDSTGAVIGTSATLSNVGAGTYYLTVTDANGCIESSSSLVGFPDVQYPNDWTDEEFTCFLQTANCCAANLAWEHLSALRGGLTGSECLRDKAWLISNYVHYLKCWYPAGQAISGGTPSFEVIKFTYDESWNVVISFMGVQVAANIWTQVGVTTLGTAVDNLVNDINTSLGHPFRAERYGNNLTSYLYIFGPNSEHFNGNYLDLNIIMGSISVNHLTYNGFIGGSSPLGAHDDDGTYVEGPEPCLSVEQVENIIEIIKRECGCCNCNQLSDISNDRV